MTGWANALLLAAAEQKAYERGRIETLRKVLAMLEQRREWAKPMEARLAFDNAARAVVDLLTNAVDGDAA